LRNSLDDHAEHAQSGLTLLASVASTAPFVGLFGTVWGIYHALLSIGATQQFSIDRVAGPVGEALIMTALGLLVAIPAVLGYNTLVRTNKRINHQLNRHRRTRGRIHRSPVFQPNDRGLTMAFKTQDDDDEAISEINMIPFIDVMLVLLIIFIITVPVLKHAVPVDLPRASAQKQQEDVEHLRVSVQASGQYFWNDKAISDEAIDAQFLQSAALSPQPELHLSADKAVRYERVAQIMAMARRAGLKKIGLVTQPSAP
jgi:biopolymer transport protein ExbD